MCVCEKMTAGRGRGAAQLRLCDIESSWDIYIKQKQ